MKKALVSSAFFYACLLAPSAQAIDCPPSEITEEARVRHVHDGDTLWLEDGRKIRLIGIDTPELARKQLPAQPYASEARSALVKLLKQSNNQVGLSYGPQRHDKYQRSLAHLFLPDGTSLQAELLKQGLATAFTTPPNDRRSRCYRQVEIPAIKKGLGIWSLPAYQLKTSFQLNDNDRGFRRIQGRVNNVRFSKKASWINLDNKVDIRIAEKDLANFNLHELKTLKNKTLRIRGWLHPRKNKSAQNAFFMALRHPDAMMINPTNNTP